MAKATLLQRLLNNPSQTYSFPAEKNYHSTKDTLLKIATDIQPITTSDPILSLDDSPAYFDLQMDNNSSDEDEFFTPRSSFYSSTDSSTPPTLLPVFAITQPTPPAPEDDWAAASTSSLSLQNDAWSDTAETSSIFSAAPSTSTRVTTPLNSDSGHSSSVITTSSASTSKRTTRKSTYTDQDWAKDVRWLVPADQTILAQPQPRRKKSTRRVVSSETARSSKGKARMSAVLEVSEDEDSQLAATQSAHGHRTQQNLRVPTRSRSTTSHRSSRSGKPSSTSSRYTTVVVPTIEPPAPPSRGTAPYSSLVLARASALPPSHAIYSSSARQSGFFETGTTMLDKLKIEDSGKVDLTRSGMASTTMATIEVVKGGAAAMQALRGSGTLGRSFSWGSNKSKKSDRSNSSTPSHLTTNIPTPLGFCSRLPPPSYVPSTHVLVQVWAVALDERDEVVIRKEKTGFVPGRSFVGRVVETGWEVPDEIIKKGEWAIGLVEVKKCGALAEFIVVDKTRLHRVAQPALDDQSGAGTLSIEELALLPLCGVPALRAAKTFDPSVSTSPNPASSSHGRKRILVLEGHQGTGALCARMLAKKGWNVLVQVSPSPLSPLEAVERRVRAWGVEEVCFGDPLGVLRRLAERGAACIVDGVLDTVGGADIWAAAQRVLVRPSPSITKTRSRSSSSSQNRPQVPQSPSYSQTDPETPPQFTTTIGDDPTRPIPSAQDHFKAGLRSLKRAVGTGCGYAWVSVSADIDSEGVGVAEALGAVVRWAEVGVRPWVDDDELPVGAARVVRFEDAPGVFDGASVRVKGGGTVVVKVVG